MLLFDLYKVLNNAVECEVLTMDNEQLYYGEFNSMPNKLLFSLVLRITIVSPFHLIIRVKHE